MECKLSAENDRLEKELEQSKKDISYWKDEFNRMQDINHEWCVRIEKIVNELESGRNWQGSGLCLEERLLKLFDDYVNLRKELGKPITTSFGQCANTHCRRYMSTTWDFCPHCGRPITGKPVVELKEMFTRMEERLPIDTAKDKEFQWRLRWSWLKKRIFEGDDYNE